MRQCYIKEKPIIMVRWDSDSNVELVIGRSGFDFLVKSYQNFKNWYSQLLLSL